MPEQNTETRIEWKQVSNWIGVAGLVLFLMGLTLKGLGVWGESIALWDLFTACLGLKAFFLPVDASTFIGSILEKWRGGAR